MAKQIATHLILIAGLLSAVILLAKFQSNHLGLQSKFPFTGFSSDGPYRQSHTDAGKSDIACSGVHGSKPLSHCQNGNVTDGDRRYPGSDKDMSQTHHMIYSVSTPDRVYFKIDFGKRSVINPSIIPHQASLELSGATPAITHSSYLW